MVHKVKLTFVVLQPIACELWWIVSQLCYYIIDDKVLMQS